VVPVLDTGWLALLTGTTGVPALAAAVETVTDAVAESLSFGP
jgi:NADPH-dependent ferric siderophore reductase